MGRIEELRVVNHAADAAVFHLRDAIGEAEDSMIVRNDDHATFRRAGKITD